MPFGLVRGSLSRSFLTIEGEPQYTAREGGVTHIDDAGQIHGTCGGYAIVPGVDTYIILPNTEK